MLLMTLLLFAVHRKVCSEDLVNRCYQKFNRNSSSICREVKNLRMCISELAGCHVTKHPKFVLSMDILEKHRKCFFVNYSRILEVLKKKGGHKIVYKTILFKSNISSRFACYKRHIVIFFF